MKKYILLITATLLVGLSSCLKKEDLPPPHNALAQLGKDTLDILKFLSTNGIAATKLGETGIYYKITYPGNGDITPKDSSKISIKYTGRFLNGNVFAPLDSLKDIELYRLILGFRYGIPQIKKGGVIRLFISSGYAYGQFGAGNIPPNTNLDFDIELKDVK